MKALLEKRAELYKRMCELRDAMNAEGHEVTAEERENWHKLNQDFDALEEQIAREKRFEVATAAMDASADSRQIPGREDRTGDAGSDKPEPPTMEERARALAGWFRAGSPDEPRDEEVQAAQKCGLNLDRRYMTVRLSHRAPKTVPEARAMSALDGSDGGLLVADTFVPSLELALLAFGGVRQSATVIRTARGEEITYPIADDTSNKGRRIGENKAMAETSVSVAACKLHAHEYTSDILLVPASLLQDSSIDLPNVIGSMLGERIGRIQADEFTTGTGNSQPNGIVTASALGVTTASATAITWNELIEQEHDIDPAYRATGCAYMFNDATLELLRKIKDGEGRYIWNQGNIQDGVPGRINGYPYYINQSMASAASDTKPVVFGQLSRYIVRDVNTITLRRLDERYAEYNQVAFLAIARSDGNLKDAGAHPVKYMLMAT